MKKAQQMIAVQKSEIQQLKSQLNLPEKQAEIKEDSIRGRFDWEKELEIVLDFKYTQRKEVRKIEVWDQGIVIYFVIYFVSGYITAHTYGNKPSVTMEINLRADGTYNPNKLKGLAALVEKWTGKRETS